MYNKHACMTNPYYVPTLRNFCKQTGLERAGKGSYGQARQEPQPPLCPRLLGHPSAQCAAPGLEEEKWDTLQLGKRHAVRIGGGRCKSPPGPFDIELGWIPHCIRKSPSTSKTAVLDPRILKSHRIHLGFRSWFLLPAPLDHYPER